MKVIYLECLEVIAFGGREIRFSCDTCIITLKRDGFVLEIHTVFVFDWQNL